MTSAIRTCAAITLLLAPLVTGCAGTTALPPPRQTAGAPRFVCPDGRSFAAQFDPDTQQTDLFLTGAQARRLAPIPDPDGGLLYEDADFQLRPGPTATSDILTDRATTIRQTCTHVP